MQTRLRSPKLVKVCAVEDTSATQADGHIGGFIKMDDDSTELVANIRQTVTREDFLEVAERCVELLAVKDTTGESIAPLLRLIEDYPAIDFGMPGPIVHFLERFRHRGYEQLLVESVVRKPVPHNLWMLNRLINGTPPPEKWDYAAVLTQVASRNDIPVETSELANSFLDFHMRAE